MPDSAHRQKDNALSAKSEPTAAVRRRVDRYHSPDTSPFNLEVSTTRTQLSAKRSQENKSLATRDAEPRAYVPKMPPPYVFGRPTVYTPQMCEIVIEDARCGHTLGATWALLQISRQTMNQWVARHPEFADAVSRAKNLRQRTYEGELIDVVRRGGDSSRLNGVKFALLNVAPDDWKEKLPNDVNVSFSLAALIDASMKTIEGELGDEQAPEISKSSVR